MVNYYGAELTNVLVFSSLPLHAVYIVVLFSASITTGPLMFSYITRL